MNKQNLVSFPYKFKIIINFKYIKNALSCNLITLNFVSVHNNEP